MLHKPLKKMMFLKILVAAALLFFLPSVARKAIGNEKATPAPPAVTARAPRPSRPAPPAPPAPPEERERHGWLGVTLSDEDGAQIEGVRDGSPAEEAGLQEGDRILEIDGRKVAGSRDVHRAIRDLEPGDTVQIRIERSGKEKTLSATLGEPPEDMDILREMHRWIPEGGPHPGPYWMDYSRSYIGIQVQPMTEDLRAYFKAPRGKGLLISKVKDGTPAAKAKLRAGDVIIAADTKGVSDHADLREALADHEPGDKVSLRIVRDGSELTVEVEVARRDGPGRRRGAIFLPDDNEIQIESMGEQPTEEIHKALKQAMRGLERTRMEREEMGRGIHEAMKQLQLSQHEREGLRRQIQEAMEQAREAVRQAAESIRGLSDTDV